MKHLTILNLKNNITVYHKCATYKELRSFLKLGLTDDQITDLYDDLHLVTDDYDFKLEII